MSNSGLDPTNFITKVQAEGCNQLTWTAEKEEKVFAVAIGGSLGQFKICSKSQ